MSKERFFIYTKKNKQLFLKNTTDFLAITCNIITQYIIQKYHIIYNAFKFHDASICFTKTVHDNTFKLLMYSCKIYE